MKNHDKSAKAGDIQITGGGETTASSDASLRHIEEALRGLRYGSVVVTVHDGVVVQIERTEKTRISR